MPVDLTAEQVRASLHGHSPESIRQYGVEVDGTTWPVKQVLELATGVPRRRWVSTTARRHLANLGFRIVGEAQPRTVLGAARTRTEPGPNELLTEEAVQALLVQHLVGTGWSIERTANTATKEAGIDVVATRERTTLCVEVKGWPSRRYADPRRSDEAKKTRPSTQAGHWFAAALHAGVKMRERHPDAVVVLAFPDVPRYRDLYDATRATIWRIGIEIWYVAADGSVRTSGPADP